MAELAVEQGMNFADHLATLRRRRGLIALVAGGVFVLGLITALVWPPTYEASATILIEEQDIPVEMIQSTVTSYAAQRIQMISQRVMSRSNLLEIIEKYNLYERERRLHTTEEVLLDMREDINIEMINAEVMDPRTGRPTAATIAFTLGFSSDNPFQALKVANELTTLYLDENLKSRTDKAAETFDFLSMEASRLSEEIGRLEKALADFKEKNVNTLPELRDINTTMLERTEREIDDIDSQIRGLEERRVYLGGQLAVMDPYGSNDFTSPSARLDALRTEYIRLTSRYSADHPDVANVRREIRALELETGQVTSTAGLQDQLAALRNELAIARENYTDEHPDVKRLTREIASLENEITGLAATPPTDLPAAVADNPAYVNLSSQLAAADTEIRSLRGRRTQLQEKVADYEARLLQTPRSEQEYRAIVRDLESSTRRYQDIKAKQMTAEVAQEMEKERKGEKFTLIDPAILPEEPVSPNRGAIILLSLVLAMGAGFGTGMIRESLDTAVRGAKGLTNLVQVAPLAVIPYLANAAETGRRRRRRLLLLIASVATVVVVLALVHFLISPLDVMWFRGLRKVNQLVGE